MVLCETEVISGPFFHISSHILQSVPQNVLKCNLIVITVAMPLSNSIEVFVWVVYCGFPTKNIIFIIFNGSIGFFRAVALKPKLCNLRLYFSCNNILQQKIISRHRKQFCTLRALAQGLLRVTCVFLATFVVNILHGTSGRPAALNRLKTYFLPYMVKPKPLWNHMPPVRRVHATTLNPYGIVTGKKHFDQ